MAGPRKTPAKKTGSRSRKRKAALLPAAIGRAVAAAQRLGSHPVGLALSVVVALAATVITANHFLSRPMTPPAPAQQTPVAQVAVKPPPLPPTHPPVAEAAPEPLDPPPLA